MQHPVLYTVIQMDSISQFVRLCGEVGNYTKRLTGVSVVDAYFGPKELAPGLQDQNRSAEALENDLTILLDELPEALPPSLRLDYLLGEVRSLISVVQWLDDRGPEYLTLVSDLFHIRPQKFPDAALINTLEELDNALSESSENELADRVHRLVTGGMLQGDELKAMILGDLQQKSVTIGRLFRERVFSLIDDSVQDNGVEYQVVSGMPWSGYNFYLGGFKSVNQFNIDRSFNQYSMQSVIYHEYEHHVANLWREKAYRQHGCVDLSIVPLHTGRCVISEGTADTAMEFLGIKNESPMVRAMRIYYRLRRMVTINAAIMVNHENHSVDDTLDYIMEHTFQNRDYAKAVMMFIRPQNDDGSPNFWAPYVFTYHIGRLKFVLPTFLRAQSDDRLPEFFRILYSNPYSRSSVTWKRAFEEFHTKT